MAAKQPIFIWRKSVTAVWLRENEVKVNAITGIAVIEWPAKKRLTLEAACGTAGANRLVAVFGGRTEKLPRDWLKQFLAAGRNKPLFIGKRLLISERERPSISETPPSLLVIPAGAAFGTGDHATTAMSLRLLERITRRLQGGWRMLDAGTGSGILALAGRRFGAGPVLAIDHDPLAISTAKRNAQANRIRGMKFVVGDVRKVATGNFAVITANLYSELLTEMLPVFARNLDSEGSLIVSGLLRAQEADLIRRVGRHGFEVRETRRRGKWIALWLRRRSSRTGQKRP